ncbi:matrixin family metalloprotease [Chloroflexota bacterium]
MKMAKVLAFVIVLLLLLSLTSPVLAAKPTDSPGNGPPELEQIVFIHYFDDSSPAKPDKPPKPDKPGQDEEDPSLYYELLRLKLPEAVRVYINNTLAEDTKIAIVDSFSTWEVETESILFDEILLTDANIFGILNNDLNTVSFGDLNDPNVIGVTSLWYFPGRPPRTIVEWDVVFNTDFVWATNGNPDFMDVQNIATHEIGHVLGLADLYELNYSEQTMYGYSDNGELKKRDLLTGDRLGAQSLYGSP